MDTQIKEKWVTALRSGKYRQGHGQLRSEDDKFCCLGVLCVVTGVDTKLRASGNYLFFAPDKALRVSRLGGEAEARLVRMNDSERRTFVEIADYIESHL